MFNFKRSAPKTDPQTETGVRPAQTAPRRKPPSFAARGADPSPPAEHPPLPEVTEGNLESDWALWEDSVAFQESQMPSSYGELDSVRTKDDKPTDDVADPFAAVRRRGG